MKREIFIKRNLVVFGLFFLVMLIGPALSGESITGPLFMDSDTGPEISRSDLDRRLIIRERWVTVDFHMLCQWETLAAENQARWTQRERQPTHRVDLTPREPVDRQPPGLDLNLFEDVYLRALIRRYEKTPSGGCLYVGEVDGYPESEVILVVSGNVLSGNITVPGHFYQIRYHAEGIYNIRELDRRQYPPEATPVIAAAPNGSIGQPEITAADSGNIIDVMVVYTAAARTAAGGTSAIENLIELAVTESNTGYGNSGVTQRFRLVHTAEVDYSEASFNWSTTLSRLKGTTDGYMDEVHAWRNVYGADEVVLIVNNTGYCGIAYVMQTVSTSFAANAFAVVSRVCATGYYSFAHELGHNMGCAHDRDNASVTGAYDYSFGYQAPDEAFRTIMAYNCPGGCTRVNYWSNPDKYYGGQPMGVVYTDPAAADNRRSLNNTASTVANFRQSTVPELVVSSPNGGENWLGGSSQAITWISLGIVGNIKIDYSADNGENWSEIVASTENDGTYNWTPPEIVSSECLVRVSDTDGSPVDTSDGVFSIYAPYIEVTSPNGGESWPVGSYREITWTSVGDIGNVKIDYSVDNGENWLEIVASTPNDGSHIWSIPLSYDDPPVDCLVKISQVNGDIWDVSDGIFSLDTVIPSITLSSPVGGENWVAGSVHAITWTSRAVYGNVKIEYSTDSGQSWQTIASSTANDGSFTWIIPGTQSNACRVRISEVDGSPTGVNPVLFSILPEQQPEITLLSPNGGEILYEGADFQITWASTASVGNVMIEYTMYNGESWAIITASTANDGSYAWTVPQVSSANCRVRVSETDGTPLDASDGVFEITGPAPAITIVSPNGGENLSAGSSHDITWASSGNINNLLIRYSTNGGLSWINIANSTENDGVHPWTVPDTPSADCLVQIVAEGAEPQPKDSSDAVFSIVSSAPTLTLLSPNGRESLAAGTVHDITWTSTGITGNVQIEYSTDSGASWSMEAGAAENNGSYPWTVPNTPSSHCLVRIGESDDEGGASDVSNGEFSITPPPYNDLTIQSPNGGETFYTGYIHEIRWNSLGDIDNVKIEYSPDNGDTWNLVTESAENSGYFQWTVPEIPSASCLVRLSDTQGSVSDTSDSIFSIIVPSALTLISPNGGETWEAGTSHDITWESTRSIGNLKIEYSLDGGIDWLNIVNTTENDGNYAWTVPGQVSENCLVRIRESDNDDGPSDTSDGPFTITADEFAEIIVLAPDSGEILYTGSTFEIAWSSSGVTGQVAIDYSVDNGQNWTEITPATDDDGSYNWLVPQESSVDCRVRIYETDGLPLDASDGVFEITTNTEPTITVTSPNGQENLAAGSSHDITWTSTGAIDNVAIEYSIDNGSSWNNISKTTTNSGNYSWTVPYTPSDICLVRVRDASLDEDSGPSDTSDAVFSITAPADPSIMVTSPNSGETILQDSTYPITWVSSGGIEEVIIEYSVNSGYSWTKIAVNPNTGSYDWLVPATPSDHCLVRISSADSDEGPWDLSDTEFSIATDTTP